MSHQSLWQLGRLFAGHQSWFYGTSTWWHWQWWLFLLSNKRVINNNTEKYPYDNSTLHQHVNALMLHYLCLAKANQWEYTAAIKVMAEWDINWMHITSWEAKLCCGILELPLSIADDFASGRTDGNGLINIKHTDNNGAAIHKLVFAAAKTPGLKNM